MEEITFQEFGSTTVGKSLSDFDHLRITHSTNIPPPIPIITIAGEEISTAANITTVSGGSKAGKSAFTGIVIAGAISTDGCIDGLEGVEVLPNTNKHAVIHIDTEQARHKQQKNIRTILKRCGLTETPDYFLSYNIRKVEVNAALQLTKDICEASCQKFGGIHLIVIDGIADFIYDPNDTVSSFAIVKDFMDIAEEYNTTVLTVVHTNPQGGKERGNLGSQLQRKSEGVIKIEKEGDLSYITTKFLRGASESSIPEIQYTYDRDKGYHVGCGYRVAPKKVSGRVVKITDACNKVFNGLNSYTYAEAIMEIMKAESKSDRTAVTYFKEMRAHELIVQGEDGRWRQSN
jgi:hypothetical protein